MPPMFIEEESFDYAIKLGLLQEADRKKILSAARRISKAADELSDLGLEVFGSSGRGSIRTTDHANIVIIDPLKGNFDGGDGAIETLDNGALVGERT